MLGSKLYQAMTCMLKQSHDFKGLQTPQGLRCDKRLCQEWAKRHWWVSCLVTTRATNQNEHTMNNSVNHDDGSALIGGANLSYLEFGWRRFIKISILIKFRTLQSLL